MEFVGERVTRMGSDPSKRARILSRLLLVKEALDDATTLQRAIGRGSDNDSLCMRIRQLHNELGCHVHDLCEGALYRSSGIEEAADRGLLTSKVVRCEHTIPVHVVAGILFNRFHGATLQSMSQFLLRNTIVTAVVRAAPDFPDPQEIAGYRCDDGRGGRLSIRRAYEGSRARTWRHKHPAYDHGSLPAVPGSLPFLRYHGTGIRIQSAVDGAEIDLERFTLADHHRYLERFPVYDFDSLLGLHLHEPA